MTKIVPILLFINFLIFIYSNKTYSKTDFSFKQQEENITLAQQYFSNQNHYMAEQVLLENIKNGQYYLPTYSLLIDLYQFGELYKKTLKLIYFVISKEHTNKILNYPVSFDLKLLLKKMPKPSEQILNLYKKIAENYLSILEKKIYLEKYSKSIEKKILKYFTVLDFYEYNSLNTKFSIALLYYNSSKFTKAIYYLNQIKRIYFKSKLKDLNTLDQIYYYLGSALIQVGKSQMGEIYLNKITHNKRSDQTMKEYSKQFTDYLKEDYLGFNTSIGYNYASNLFNLQNNDLLNFDSLYKDFYGESKGATQTVSISGSLTKKLSDNYVLTANSAYNQVNVTKSIIKIADSKSLTFATMLNFHNSKNFLYSLGYDYSVSFARESR